jgi:quercetin 2,3-dioxygenase
VSNLERDPAVTVCGPTTFLVDEPATLLLDGHDVPLGRYTTVRRLLPHRDRRMVGAWCFVDQYGPEDVASRPGMQVPPHPHTGLQTVSWLLAGEILHRDSVGSLQTVRPGELALMTAGVGIAHSEESPVGHPPTLHGIQLWVALPADSRAVPPAFDHHDRLPVLVDGATRTTPRSSARTSGWAHTLPAPARRPPPGCRWIPASSTPSC